jgi:hypothetical protein
MNNCSSLIACSVDSPDIATLVDLSTASGKEVKKK